MLAELPTFYKDIREIIIESRNRVYNFANNTIVNAYWEIGKRIVLEEQAGKERAEYGAGLLKELSVQLTAEFGKGFNESSLRRMRQFYFVFRRQNPFIRQS